MKISTKFAIASCIILTLILILTPKRNMSPERQKKDFNTQKNEVYLQNNNQPSEPSGKIKKEKITGTPISTGSGEIILPRDLQKQNENQIF